MKKFFIFCLLLMCLMPVSLDFESLFKKQDAEAGTQIEQTYISVDTVWTKENSPYIVTGNVWVQNGAVLNIEPGVVVKLKFTNITVDGELIASGTEAMPIVFTSYYDDSVGEAMNLRDPKPRDWGAIQTRNNGKSFLNHTQVKYGGEMRIYMVKNNRFLKKQMAKANIIWNLGATYCSGASMEIKNSLIEENYI